MEEACGVFAFSGPPARPVANLTYFRLYSRHASHAARNRLVVVRVQRRPRFRLLQIYLLRLISSGRVARAVSVARCPATWRIRSQSRGISNRRQAASCPANPQRWCDDRVAPLRPGRHKTGGKLLLFNRQHEAAQLRLTDTSPVNSTFTTITS